MTDARESGGRGEFGEPLGLKGYDGEACEFPLHVGESLIGVKAPVYDHRNIGICQFFDRGTALTVVNILNDQSSNHSPSDSVVVTREEWEKLQNKVFALIGTTRDHNSECISCETLRKELKEVIMDIDARSALEAAERGRK